MNILLNKQCTWKMLETLGCGEEVNIHSSSFPKGQESRSTWCTLGMAGDSREARISGK